MPNRSTANVIDLEAFRQRKRGVVAERPSEPTLPSDARPVPMMMPVWVWVPVWTPFG
jgi:hypothetical protein